MKTRAEPTLRACECEHIQHTDEEIKACVAAGRLSYPHQDRALTLTRPIDTIYGTFHVCETCESECLHDMKV